MALQTQNLTIVGLGSAKDTSPNSEQPPLIDGIHLRWAFKRELGFPWHGFYLFRRVHDPGTLSWLSQHTGNLPTGPWSSNSIDTPLLLSATDATIDSGSVGFYAPGPSTAKFTDIYVDDFRSSVPVVYRFNFLSSRFKNFKEQIESFENKTVVATIDGLVNAAPFVSAAKPIGDVLADAESRAFDGLAALLMPGIVSTPVVHATRVQQGNDAIAFLVQSPEPLDWNRIDLKVLRSELGNPYEDVSFKVLRKADGAGLMIVSSGSTPSGSLLKPGEYRLVFTYRRNNRARDQNSDVLSEAGITDPEVVTLDLPWPLEIRKMDRIDDLDRKIVDVDDFLVSA
jgi:hypothetical protein